MTMVSAPDSGGLLPAGLDATDARLVNLLQDGIAFVARPFAAPARQLGLSEEELTARITRLVQEGFATRFGPLIDAEMAGGAYMLAALAVPTARFAEVAAIVNGFREVAHNYARDHHYNMWFVLAGRDMAHLQRVAEAIEQRCGLTVLRLPREAEYFVDFRVRLAVPPLPGERPPAAVPPRRQPARRAAGNMDDADRALLGALQAGMTPQPDLWAAAGRHIGMAGEEVRRRLQRLHERGIIRRIALVPNHFRLGWRANGMTVWDVDDARIDELGRAVGALPFVSHCYRRPRREGWPYNLFAMVHGRSVAEMRRQVAQVQRLLGEAARAHAVLRSTRILKKTGVRLFGLREGAAAPVRSPTRPRDSFVVAAPARSPTRPQDSFVVAAPARSPTRPPKDCT